MKAVLLITLFLAAKICVGQVRVNDLPGVSPDDEVTHVLVLVNEQNLRLANKSDLKTALGPNQQFNTKLEARIKRLEDTFNLILSEFPKRKRLKIVQKILEKYDSE